MASVSSAHLVLFIAAILIAAVLAGTMTESASRVGNAIEEQSNAESAQTNAEIAVVSDPDSPATVYNNSTDTLTVLVKNVGGSTLPSGDDDVTVLVNGHYQTDVRTTILDDTRWRPGSLLRVRVNVTLADDTATRVVVTPTGARDTFTFTTP